MNANAVGSGRVWSLDEYRELRARRDIENQFAICEEAVAEISELLVPIRAWRAQARQAAAALGRKVRTGLSPDEESLWARLVPIPMPPPIVTEHANGFRLFTNPWMVDRNDDEDPWTDECA